MKRLYFKPNAEVIKEGDVYTNKIIGKALTSHADAYWSECNM